MPVPAIVHVVDSLEFGGLERVVADLASAQAAAGAQVAIFSLLATDGLREEIERGGTVSVVQGHKRSGLDRVLLGRLRALVRDMRPCVVHTHNFVPNYYAALATLGLRGATLVNTCHNMGGRLAASGRLRWLYRLSLARTGRVAVVGRQARDTLVDMGIVPDARAEAVANGIPLQRHGNTPERRAAAREALGLAQDALVIGSVGRLVPLKNQALLLGCVPALARSHSSLRVVLLGDGPLADGLRAQADALGITERVVFAGARHDVAALLPAFDVFALPSRTEGLSIALLEACAAALPIVASRVGGTPEIIADGMTGRLFASDDGAALEHALDGLLRDAALRARLGAAARAWVEAEGSIEAMRGRYDALYAGAMRSVTHD